MLLDVVSVTGIRLSYQATNDYFDSPAFRAGAAGNSGGLSAAIMERMPIPTLETLSRKQQSDSPKSEEPGNPGLFSLSHRAAKSGKRAVDHCIPPRHALPTCTMWGQVLVSSCSVGYFHLIVLIYLRNGSLMSVLFLVRSLRPPMSENRCIPICGTPIYQ